MPCRRHKPPGPVGLTQSSTGFSQGGWIERASTTERVIIETAVQGCHAEAEIREIEHAELLFGYKWKRTLTLIEGFVSCRKVM